MLDFGVHEKDFCMNRVMSLLRKSEMSSVSSKAKEAISCRPLGWGGGGGEGTKRRITFQTMVKHVPLVAGIQFPTQSCLSHDHWFINGCSHYCRSSSSADFTQSLLFSFSLRKTPRGYLKKNYSGEAHITKAWKRYPFRAKPTCTRIYTPLLGVTPPPSPLPWRKANGLLKGWGIPTIAEKRKIIITTT